MATKAPRERVLEAGLTVGRPAAQFAHVRSEGMKWIRCQFSDGVERRAENLRTIASLGPVGCAAAF